MGGQQLRVLEDCTPDRLHADVITSTEPLLLKGLVRDWPLVRHGLRSDLEAARYLNGFYSGAPLTAYLGGPEIKGRFFYNEDCTDINFKRGTATLEQVFERLFHHGDEADSPTIYVGSTMVDKWLPGLRRDNDLPLAELEPLVSIWIGNRSRISAHFDFPSNIACSVVGRRRFTLFPPDQLENLYIGPLDLTPSGQAISMVDFAAPDFDHFPRFATALQHALYAEMEPGDAVYIPSMWFHHVESQARMNVLVNYWWCNSPAFMGAPSSALQHAVLSLRDLPPEQRKAWKRMFDFYVFDADPASFAHIPEPGRGVLAPLDDASARRIRADLLNKLNR